MLTIAQSLKKVPGVAHPQPWDEILQFCKLWRHPTVVLSVVGYSFLHYEWFLSFLTMEPAAYAQYKVQIQGLLTVGMLVGIVAAEMLCSGRLSDKFMAVLTKRNGGVRVPEMRLWFGYPSAFISALGLLLWGLSVDREWHWMVGQIAFFLCECCHSQSLRQWLISRRRFWPPDWQHRRQHVRCRQVSRALHRTPSLVTSVLLQAPEASMNF